MSWFYLWLVFTAGYLVGTWARESDLIRVFKEKGKLAMIFHKSIYVDEAKEIITKVEEK